MQIFSWFSDQFLKMQWLSNIIKWVLETVFNMSISTNIGGGVHFFIYDVIKIFILLSVLIFFVSYIQSYFPPERTKKILGKFKGIKGNIMGALLGTITPFCSCSSIPIFIGFTSAGLPLGITFSFLISSPLVDIASLLILISFFGIKIGIIYVLIGLVLAVIGGTIIDKLHMEDQIQDYIREIKDVDIVEEELTKKQRVDYSTAQVKLVIKKVWMYILIGVGIGAAIHNFIPQSVIENIIGSNNPFAVILATLVGIPMYADIFGTIPIAEALFLKGITIGTVLAFMMSVTTLSAPSMVMISRVVKPKLLIVFISIVTFGIIFIGYIFNMFSYLLV
ncbi:MAG: permease [Clostridia bacterium]|nr:permease [Clostridia bacterium]MDD4387064.1 permease [Clostridia bacterium]